MNDNDDKISTNKQYFDFIDKLFNSKNYKTNMNIQYNIPPPHFSEHNSLSEKNSFTALINLNKVKAKTFSEVKSLTFYNINDFIKMHNGEEGQLYYTSDVDYVAYQFQNINGIYPCAYKFDDIVNIQKFINNLFKYYDVPLNSYTKICYQDENEIKLISFTISFAKDLILLFTSSDGGIILYNIDDEKNKQSKLYTLLGLLKSCLKPKIYKNKIFIVYRNSGGFDKIGFDIKKTTVNLNENYNDDFIKVSENIIKGLNDKNKTRLVILQGLPGTGKSYYLRYLTSKIKKNIIFIPPEMVNSITDPAFIPFLMENSDSILIIEDAEPVLEKRNTSIRSSAVSNVLNLTDGLLSDCLNISIVATFNIKTSNIDDALLRKGRLLMNYKFEKLCIEKSKALLEKLNFKDIDVREPMTLADIFNYGTENNVELKTKKIGFA